MFIDEATQILNSIRTQTGELERLLRSHYNGSTSGEPVAEFDPDRDQPSLTPDPRGRREEGDWCSVVLWAKLRAINVRQGRGATYDEVVEIAKAAGYRDGRGWNRWHGWKEDGGRWVDDDGMKHLRHYYRAVNREIPDDLA